MTDKEKLNAIRAEVEKYIDAARKAHTNITEGNFAHLLSFINSLQEEPMSKELEEAAVEAFKHIVDSDKNSFLEIFKAGAKWKEEQIMKDAIDAKIGSRVEGIIYDVDFNIDSNLEPNDKVKVIIIKSE